MTGHIHSWDSRRNKRKDCRAIFDVRTSRRNWGDHKRMKNRSNLNKKQHHPQASHQIQRYLQQAHFRSNAASGPKSNTDYLEDYISWTLVEIYMRQQMVWLRLGIYASDHFLTPGYHWRKENNVPPTTRSQNAPVAFLPCASDTNQ